jgi:hypothetical protein
MTLPLLRTFLLYCSLMNYAILILWFILYMGPLKNLREIKTRWYRVIPEQFDSINFTGIVLYKTTIIFFNIVPYVALWLIR